MGVEAGKLPHALTRLLLHNYLGCGFMRDESWAEVFVDEVHRRSLLSMKYI